MRPSRQKRGVRFRKEEQLLKAEEDAKRRMEGADARRKEHRKGIVRKANEANSKVGIFLYLRVEQKPGKRTLGALLGMHIGKGDDSAT